jgi:hypothetical protein
MTSATVASTPKVREASSAWRVQVFAGVEQPFAGATGTCALATVLEYMPWNAVFRAECKK